ncbi:Uma2 family endonuclease [Runella salmonicolor]|uniref:Uma2 family endonuclease n=1 Tax=Runella salmonicolor TaxID=2950278 RepID=A0ABT1FUZ3_9BACT|nr:Uma2 family endonuclease [Runella salmonicolor]MCP1385526.1 Uma2 family endonuclease [Runella salmonicolor]
MSTLSFSDLDPNGIYTYADYLKWTFDERLELIKGKIFNMSPAPARRHQKISGKLFTPISNFLEGKLCEVYSAPFDVRLTPLKGKKRKDNQIYTVVQPDICVICDVDKLDDRGCIGAPDLIIEILSPGNTKKEMSDKFQVYEENGVTEYWLVEPNDNVIFVYVLNDEGKYIGLKPYTEDDILTSSVLPGLEVSVSRIFEP